LGQSVLTRSHGVRYEADTTGQGRPPTRGEKRWPHNVKKKEGRKESAAGNGRQETRTRVGGFGPMVPLKWLGNPVTGISHKTFACRWHKPTGSVPDISMELHIMVPILSGWHNFCYQYKTIAGIIDSAINAALAFLFSRTRATDFSIRGLS